MYNYDRRRVAMEFPTEEALKKYLHEHPGADSKNHSVSKGDDGEGELSPEEKAPSAGPKRDEEKIKGWHMYR